MRKIPSRILLSCLILFSFVVGSRAAPDLFRFQGRLTDSQGRPITGTPQVSFEIYDAATAGTRLWGPTAFQNVNANDAGLFATDIGPFASQTIFSGTQDLYLQVTIKAGTGQTNQVLSPRQRLTAVPFSFRANRADQATTADTVPDGSITAAKIQSGAVGSNQISDRSIQPIDLSTTVASQFIPSGMIAMFARSCPAGWTRFAEMDNRFPIGASDYTGVFGGSSTLSGQTEVAGVHKHNMGNHTHTISHKHVTPLIGTVPGGPANFGMSGNSAIWGEGYQDITMNARGPAVSLPDAVGTWRFFKTKDSDTPASGSPNVNDTSDNGAHIHNFNAGAWRPPYLGVVYCEKD